MEWLVRACQDRGLIATEDAPEVTRLREAALPRPCFIRTKFRFAAGPQRPHARTDRRQPRSDRKAVVSIRDDGDIRPPSRPGHKLPPVTVNLVLVREEAPPEGEEPVEWLLITTLPIASLEDVRNIISYYTVRWMIELLLRTLKSGCRVEERRFEHVDRLLPCQRFT